MAVRSKAFPIGLVVGSVAHAKPFAVYMLRAEGDMFPFYVGCSSNVLRRLNQHWWDAICAGFWPLRIFQMMGWRCHISILAAFDDRTSALAYESEVIGCMPGLLNQRLSRRRALIEERAPMM